MGAGLLAGCLLVWRRERGGDEYDVLFCLYRCCMKRDRRLLIQRHLPGGGLVVVVVVVGLDIFEQAKKLA